MPRFVVVDHRGMALDSFELSRRLWAARALRRRPEDVKGFLPREVLAKTPQLKAVQIDALYLGHLEREEPLPHGRSGPAYLPTVLAAIAEALEIPYAFFVEEDPFSIGSLDGDDGQRKLRVALNNQTRELRKQERALREVQGSLDDINVRLDEVKDRLPEPETRDPAEEFDKGENGHRERLAEFPTPQDGAGAATHSPPTDDEDERAEQARARARQWRERDERDEREARSPHGSDVDEAASSD